LGPGDGERDAEGRGSPWGKVQGSLILPPPAGTRDQVNEIAQLSEELLSWSERFNDLYVPLGAVMFSSAEGGRRTDIWTQDHFLDFIEPAVRKAHKPTVKLVGAALGESVDQMKRLRRKAGFSSWQDALAALAERAT